MLLYLRVKNFAIIDQLEVEFCPSFNVVTGETGAGKSILVDALKLVLGGNIRSDVVRKGSETAEVEALFDVKDDPEVKKRMEDIGITSEEELIVRRVVYKTGRTRAYINGRMASSSQLGKLAVGLADISSQHEHHTLIDPKSHLLFLDAFAGLTSLRQDVSLGYRSLVEIRDELKIAQQHAKDLIERKELLRFQIEEIDELDPQEGELPPLREERDIQRNAEELISLTGNGEQQLYACDDAICEQLSRIVDSIRQAATLDPSLAALADQLASAQLSLEEAGRELGQYSRQISIDTDRLAQLEKRIDTIDRLQKKYGGSIDSMLQYRKQIQIEFDDLSDSDERIEDLHRRLQHSQEKVTDLAKSLSAKRREAAEKLSSAISHELGSLGMGNARVIVEVNPMPEQTGGHSIQGAALSPNGIDRVEFLIATNRGEEPQPLSKIASGGELSRAMLAVKRVLSGLGPAGLYVFDEVDAGVGGAIAEVIGRKLQDVSQHHQVICITHLAQIAIFADTHFYVHKQLIKGRTLSQINRLNKDQQKQEIARMLGGVRITAKTKAAAAEMLATARGKPSI